MEPNPKKGAKKEPISVIFKNKGKIFLKIMKIGGF
jgi:hypothetical protein